MDGRRLALYYVDQTKTVQLFWCADIRDQRALTKAEAEWPVVLSNFNRFVAERVTLTTRAAIATEELPSAVDGEANAP